MLLQRGYASAFANMMNAAPMTTTSQAHTIGDSKQQCRKSSDGSMCPIVMLSRPLLGSRLRMCSRTASGRTRRDLGQPEQPEDLVMAPAVLRSGDAERKPQDGEERHHHARARTIRCHIGVGKARAGMPVYPKDGLSHEEHARASWGSRDTRMMRAHQVELGEEDPAPGRRRGERSVWSLAYSRLTA